MDGNESKGKKEIFSSAVRAGRRTYFFDVKKTKRGDLYLTVTESKKVFDNKDGSFHFEKHKLFLYKEDFDKFSDAYQEAVAFIKENVDNYLENPEGFDNQEKDNSPAEPPKESPGEKSEVSGASDFTDVDFDDLDKD